MVQIWLIFRIQFVNKQYFTFILTYFINGDLYKNILSLHTKNNYKIQIENPLTLRIVIYLLCSVCNCVIGSCIAYSSTSAFYCV